MFVLVFIVHRFEEESMVEVSTAAQETDSRTIVRCVEEGQAEAIEFVATTTAVTLSFRPRRVLQQVCLVSMRDRDREL